MKHCCALSLIIALFIILILPAGLQAQDPGNADTVRIGAVSVNPYDHFAVPVYLYNDEELASLVIPLIINNTSGLARFDSVSYVDSRLTDPLVLDSRLATLFASDSVSVDSVVLEFQTASGSSLPAGEGKLCDIWLTASFSGLVPIDSSGQSPQGRLQIISTATETFTPEFESGLITIACNYVVGDVRNDGKVSVDDWLGFFKSYYGCMWTPYPNFVASDMNADHLVDMRDLRMLMKALFAHASLPPCRAYSPALYNDPGLPDTIWIAGDTLIVGVTDTVAIGIINDEPLSGIALGLEWDGSAVLNSGYTFNNYVPTSRVSQNDFRNYQCYYSTNGVNPDTTFIATYRPGYNDSTWIAPGRGAIYGAIFHPVTPGTTTARLVPFPGFNASSMLVTDSGEAILPPVVGQVTVVAPTCGDANADLKVNVGDAVYIISYIFRAGPPPAPACAGNANGDSSTNVGDAVYLINYVFKAGSPPVAGCCP